MAYEQNLFPYTKNFKPNFIKIVLVLIVLSVFGVSLVQVPFLVEGGVNGEIVHSSFGILIVGSMAILGGGVLEWIIWLANPICLISIMMFLYSDKQ